MPLYPNWLNSPTYCQHIITSPLIHITQLHSGVSATLAALRQSYWVPSARQQIKSIIHKSVVCRKSSGKPYTIPDPPPLVQSRVTYTNPFIITGVDFTGALYVRSTEGGRKVYLCLFTCAACRAVHLELVNDLTVECFLQAFRRFAGQRSLPRLLLSDNGSTFLAAAEEVKTLLSSTELTEALAHKGLEWKFIPKRAPWFGSFWEGLIGLTKSTLKKTLGRTHATLESLQTIIVEVEALLNDRLLIYASSDIKDLNPITPSHLPHGRRIVKLPHINVQEDEIHGPDFTTGNNHQAVKVGDVVLIHDDTARVNWRMAVIESVNKGADGMIRSANIRTSTGRTNRPIARLYPLELTDNTTASISTDDGPEQSMTDNPIRRPSREAAKRGQQVVKQWIASLRAPPEDVPRI